MMRYFVLSAALVSLAACAPAVPESGVSVDTGAGVGFGNYSNYQANEAAREAQLAGQALPSAAAVSSETLSSIGLPAAVDENNSDIAAQTRAALSAADANSGEVPIDASPSNPPPVRVDSAGISDENDFDRVGTRRSRQDDAALIAANRAQYQQIEPTALPSRSGGAQNGAQGGIVGYALSTSHPVGQKVHKRFGLNAQAKFDRNCAKYPSPDVAQAAFLAKGGPDRDRLGLDPDGDGYACSWNPAPFRTAVNG